MMIGVSRPGLGLRLGRTGLSATVRLGFAFGFGLSVLRLTPNDARLVQVRLRFRVTVRARVSVMVRARVWVRVWVIHVATDPE